MRAILPSRLIVVSIGTLIGAAPAAAMPITYAWTGTVDAVGAGFPAGVTVGENIDISLTLDNSFSDDDPSPNRGSYNANPGMPPLVLAVDIGGNEEIGDFQSVEVLDDDQGVDEFMVATGSTMSDAGFEIVFQTTHVGVLTSDSIPLSIDPADFETATFSVDRTPAFTEFLPAFSGTINGAVSVPEPGSVALLGSGLLAFAGARRRRE